MDEYQLRTMVGLMREIVHSVGRMNGQDEQTGGYLCIRSNLAAGSRIECLEPIGHVSFRDADLFAFHARERAQLMSRDLKVLTSGSWGGERLGAINVPGMTLSFCGSLPGKYSEACVIALAHHTKPRLLGDQTITQILTVSKNDVFIGQLLNITRPEEDSLRV